MNKEPLQHNRFIIPASITGLSIILAMAILAFTWSGVKSESQTINVTGSAKRTINSDLGILRISLNTVEVSKSLAHKNLKAQIPLLIQYLEAKGFPKNKITYQVIQIYPNYFYNETGQQTGVRSYTGTQILEVSSPNVNLIKETSLDAVALVEKGLNISISPPEYYYTKLSAIKIDIQADAAKDAMVRGKRIAEATGRKLGVLTNARMGVLQITPENSNLTSDYGVNDVSSIRKEITAVINANFLIK